MREATLFWMSLVLVAFEGCTRLSRGPEERELALSEARQEDDDGPIEMSEGVGERGPAVAEDLGRAEVVALDGENAARAIRVDVDEDGVDAELDCDDLDDTVSPLAHEIRCNGGDENCNGVDDCDRDGDGFRDVDDLDPDVPAEGPVGPPLAPRWP